MKSRPLHRTVAAGLLLLVVGGALLLRAALDRANSDTISGGSSTMTGQQSTNTAPEPSSPAATGWPDASEVQRRIGRGVNFGNALEAPTEGGLGVTLREEYFELAKAAGFASIRLPVRWDAHAEGQSPYTISPAFFARVDWAVQNGLSRGMIVILDFHHFLPFMTCAGCERERLLALWGQVAEHYRDYPPELLFELLNEPQDKISAGLWNDIAAETLARIRLTNPRRAAIIGPINWNNFNWLAELTLPESDRRLIATFHYYEPFPFTHQGAEWVTGSDAWLGTAWTGTEAEQRAIRSDFDAAAAWSRKNDRPIFLGEFGAYRKADMDSRARYTGFVAREAEAHGFTWAYWEFCSGHGVYDPAAHAWRQPLLRALLPDSPLAGR